MISSSVDERIRAILREIQLHKSGFVAAIVIISLVMLGIGMIVPKKYDSSALLYADLSSVSTTILGPNASLNEIDHAEVAKEIIGTRRFMDKVVKNAEVVDPSFSEIEYERELAKIRAQLSVRSKGRNYIELSYSDVTPENSFSIVNAAVEAFIEESANSKSSESRTAFEFIQGQVNSYKEQLETADNRLKDFMAANRDGTKEMASTRTADLQGKIEQLKLDIDEAQIKLQSVERQIKAEGKYVRSQKASEELRKRISAARERLDNLLLSFTETHPDVLALQAQIDDMERGVTEKDVQGMSTLGSQSSKGTINPLYDELRKQRAAAKVKLQTSQKRLKVSERLLEKEFERMERIISREAKLSELTRDYDTISTYYSELLNRLENARLTMSLDIQGQGSSYKVQEPPIFPLLPSGLRFLHFLFLGPLLALIIPSALLYLYVELDPKVRMASVIQSQLRVPVLAVVPHVTTNLRQSFMRSDLIPHVLALLLVVAVYVAAAAYKLTAAS